MDLSPGAAFPDLALPDHAGRTRNLSELAAGDPLVLHTYRGWWCPKEQAYFRLLAAFQEEVEVAYASVVSVSVDPVPVVPPSAQGSVRAGPSSPTPSAYISTSSACARPPTRSTIRTSRRSSCWRPT